MHVVVLVICAGGIGFDSLDSLIHSIVGGGHNNQPKRYAKNIANVVSGLGNCAADTVRVILVMADSCDFRLAPFF